MKQYPIMSFNFFDSFFSFLPLKYRLSHSLEKDRWSSEYPLETNKILDEAIKAIKAAKNERQALQIAIGIYNWIAAGNRYGFQAKTLEVGMFLQKKFSAETAKFTDSTAWGQYFASLGLNGVMLAPAKFKEKSSPKERGYPYAKTPLFHLQTTLENYDANLFIKDCYERQYSDQQTLDSYKAISLLDLKLIIINAAGSYKAYHKEGSQKFNRGLNAGFFSFLRHGNHGITVADNFKKDICQYTETAEKALTKIKDFLGDPARSYHNHSFTSYLADALAKKGLVTAHKKEHYKPIDLVRELEIGMHFRELKQETSMETNEPSLAGPALC